MSEPENSGRGQTRADRRKHPRKKPQALVYLDLGPSNGGMVRDVSEGGIGFRAVAPVRAGQRVTFAFAFEGATRLEGECELVWTDEDGKAGGLRFTEVSAELRDAVRKRLAGDSNREEPVLEPPVAAATPAASIDDIRREIRQPSGAARRLARMLAEPASVERADPAQKVQATPTAMHLPRVAEPAEEIRHEARAEVKPEIPPKTEPEIQSEIAPQIEMEVIPAVKPEVRLEARPEVRARFMPQAHIRPPGVQLSYEAMESRDEEMPGARWLDRLTLSRAIGIMLMLTLLAGGYVYHRALGESLIWLGQQIAGEETPVTQTPSLPEAALPAASLVPSETPASAKPEPDPERALETAKPSAPLPAPATSSQPAVISPGVHQAPLPTPAAQPSKNDGNGQTEFLQALQILRGKNHSGELPEAVRLLWVAVEKGNSSAEVALADLYRRGEGMPQNCDQTRILLTAAVKKGNNEARTRLAQLNQDGCP